MSAELDPNTRLLREYHRAKVDLDRVSAELVDRLAEIAVTAAEGRTTNDDEAFATTVEEMSLEVSGTSTTVNEASLEVFDAIRNREKIAEPDQTSVETTRDSAKAPWIPVQLPPPADKPVVKAAHAMPKREKTDNNQPEKPKFTITDAALKDSIDVTVDNGDKSRATLNEIICAAFGVSRVQKLPREVRQKLRGRIRKIVEQDNTLLIKTTHLRLGSRESGKKKRIDTVIRTRANQEP